MEGEGEAKPLLLTCQNGYHCSSTKSNLNQHEFVLPTALKRIKRCDFCSEWTSPRVWCFHNHETVLVQQKWITQEEQSILYYTVKIYHMDIKITGLEKVAQTWLSILGVHIQFIQTSWDLSVYSIRCSLHLFWVSLILSDFDPYPNVSPTRCSHCSWPEPSPKSSRKAHEEGNALALFNGKGHGGAWKEHWIHLWMDLCINSPQNIWWNQAFASEVRRTVSIFDLHMQWSKHYILARRIANSEFGKTALIHATLLHKIWMWGYMHTSSI